MRSSFRIILALAMVLSLATMSFSAVTLLNKVGQTPSHWTGLSSDAKPTTGAYGSTFYAEDTGIPYVYGTSGWVQDKRRAQGTATNMASAIHGSTSKATPVDADEIPIWDSVSQALQKLTWANNKVTLKAYFDTLYAPASAKFITSQSEAGLTGPNLGALTTGILAHTVAGGVSTPKTAEVADFPTLNQSTTGNAATATKWGAYAGVAGPSQARTYTLPDADKTLLATDGSGASLTGIIRTFQFGVFGGNPVDNTTYYMSNTFGRGLASCTNIVAPIVTPSAVTIKKVSVVFSIAAGGTVPSTEATNSLYIRINNADPNIAISENFALEADSETIISNAGLNAALAAGSTFVIIWQSATFAQNPLSLWVSGTVEYQ